MDVKRFREILERRTSISSVTNCWIYEGQNGDGYGQVTIDYQFYYVHNLSAQLFLGYTPTPGLMVCHKPGICINKACWNPDHLYVGTAASNNLDIKLMGVGKGRFSDVTQCVNGHEFTEENTYWSKRDTGEMRRQCRTCRTIRDQESKARRKLLKQIG